MFDNIFDHKSMKIRRETLKFALEVAKESYPNEFVALLAGKKGIIEEIVFLPFSSSEKLALIHMDMLPLGYRVYGTVHSHPSPSCKPSQADLIMFSKHGIVHIIVCYPFEEGCWRFYDKNGNEIELEIVD